MTKLTPVALAAAMVFHLPALQAQTPPAAPNAPESDKTLSTVTVNASADASAQGLSPAYAGGQVARGGRAGILGTKDNLDTPFSITSYTNELIQDRQAKSVGDVLQNDPGVRTARGFGNFQESYFIRGFVLSSDDVAYNGLYSLLPRQYIATELFERVEVLRGASAFLTGANPGGGGIGGAINLLPKRAPNDPLTRLTAGAASGSQGNLALDVSRRFGPDQSTGIRVNAAYRDGGMAVDDEKAKLGLLAVGLDWRSRDVRLSGDIGYQDNRLRQTRTNVTLGATVTSVPTVPDAKTNFAQPWSYSNERDTFGTLRGEVDISHNVTAWAAYGLRRSEESNSLANVTVSNGSTGAASASRFDNTREDEVDTGELGLRAKLKTGPVDHELVVSYASFQLSKNNAYALGGAVQTNIYRPVASAQPGLTLLGNTLSDPAFNGKTRLKSLAIGDTLGFMGGQTLLTLGARHQKIDVETVTYRVVNNGVVTSPGNVSTLYGKSRTSPVAGIVFKASKQLSLYANYVEGLTQGETAPATSAGMPVSNVGTQLAPYVSKQKEIGLKYDAGRIGGGLALFSTERPRSLIVNSTFTSQGEDQHRGVELTVFGEATRGLRLLGGATWLNAEQKSTGSATTESKRVIGVPRFQASLGAEWDVPAVRGLALDTRVVHTGDSFSNAINTLKVPGWTRLDAGIRYLTELNGSALTLRTRVDNLTNKSYYASVGGFPGSGYLVVGAPRTLSVSASVDF